MEIIALTAGPVRKVHHLGDHEEAHQLMTLKPNVGCSGARSILQCHPIAIFRMANMT